MNRVVNFIFYKLFIHYTEIDNSFFPTISTGDTYSNCIKIRTERPNCNHFAQYRSYDGTCNNRYRPNWGASNTMLRRIQSKLHFLTSIHRIKKMIQDIYKENSKP